MAGFVIFLLVVWFILSIAGFVLKGFLWLALIGIALFVATAVWGWIKRKTRD